MDRTMTSDIDPRQLRIVIDELTDALISAVALGAHALQGTAADATVLDAAIRRATTTLRCLHLGQRTALRGRR
jgi:hypothetical protein